MTGPSLDLVRERIRAGDPTTRQSLDRLRADAEAALLVPARSVMDKSLVPPSGDRHDFMSIGPYWWPNPETATGLPYVRRDGEVNPERFSAATDCGALDTMARASVTLLLAAALTDDTRFGDHARRLLRAWFIDPRTRMNPHLRFGQSIPGVCAGRGIGIIDTEKLVDVVKLLRLAPPPQWTADDDRALRAWFGEYVDWLLASPLGLSERLEHNNHGTWYDAQVAWFALYCGRPTVAREIAGEVLERRIARHVEPDGSQPHELARTRPISYTCFNLLGLMQLADAGREAGVDLWNASTSDGRSIRAAANWLAPYAAKDSDAKLDPPETREARVFPALAWASRGLDQPALASGINGPGHRLHLQYPLPQTSR